MPRALVNATTVSKVAAVVDNVMTIKSFSVAQLVGESGAEARQIIIHKITVDFINASASTTFTGASAQIQAFFSATAQVNSRSVPFRGLNSSTKTRFMISNVDPGSQLPVISSDGDQLLSVKLMSVAASTYQLLINVWFRILPDDIPRVLA